MNDPFIDQAFPGKDDDWFSGMTIREYFAVKAMAAMIVGGNPAAANKKDLAKHAIEYADALAEELLKSQ